MTCSLVCLRIHLFNLHKKRTRATSSSSYCIVRRWLFDTETLKTLTGRLGNGQFGRTLLTFLSNHSMTLIESRIKSVHSAVQIRDALWKTHLTRALAERVPFGFFAVWHFHQVSQVNKLSVSFPAVRRGCKQSVFNIMEGSWFRRCSNNKNRLVRNVPVQIVLVQKKLCVVPFVMLIKSLLLSGALRSLKVAFFFCPCCGSCCTLLSFSLEERFANCQGQVLASFEAPVISQKCQETL